MAIEMDDKHRDLILAAEITGLLHDLGKLWPKFASEGMTGGTNRSDEVKSMGFAAAHGAILEDPGRAYPSPGAEPWLQQIKSHPHWAEVLRLPEGWIKPRTVQANGLGDPLRQHHATGKFPEDQLTLLGDLYTFGADIRDSALDKGSGGTGSGKQRLEHGFVADSFGNEQEQNRYGPKALDEVWKDTARIVREALLADGAWRNVARSRERFLKAIEPVFRKALGETRRPTNDVTLWHHAFSAASLFKAVVAEGVLRGGFRHLQTDDGAFDLARMGRIRFRLLGIRWDWAALTGGALQPIALTALVQARQDAVARLRKRLERDSPVGNVVYEDDDGVIFAVPGFYQGPVDADGASSENMFQERIVEPFLAGILADLAPLGAGVAVRVAWTRPALYLTDYPEVMSPHYREGEGGGERQRLLQVGEDELRALWARQIGDGQVQICPQCGLRPGRARELALNESTLRTDDERTPSSFCDHCQGLVDGGARENRKRQAEALFGIEPRSFNLQDIRAERSPGNARVALLSVRVDPLRIAGAEALVTQVARPLDDLEAKLGEIDSVDDAGQFLQDAVLTELVKAGNGIEHRISKKTVQKARTLVGDSYWLDFHATKDHEKDGRLEGGSTEKARGIVNELFLREALPEGAGLYRHDGDRVALFGARKHASPARLARTWDDLKALWKRILWDIAGDTEGWLLPLSLDTRGFRLLVAAEDARNALSRIHQQVEKTLGKVRAGLDVHVSALVFQEKFPLYVALDALRRMESRISNIPLETWTLSSALRRDESRSLHMVWNTRQGDATWDIDLGTGDSDQSDFWYPHAICVSRPEGPGRLVRLDQLNNGEIIRLRPSTFDFAVLEGTIRRYALRYDSDGRRPHFILGEPGCRPYLLEQMLPLMDLAGSTGWNPSQTKAIVGQIVECYEKWVRDAPEPLRNTGREAWHTHAAAVLRRYLPQKDKAEARERLFAALNNDGLFFDAFEWAGFIEKTNTGVVNKNSGDHGKVA